jgi:hypothetical protein
MITQIRVTLGALVALVSVCATIQADAQTVGNGPYYATPSWDQKLQCDTLSTCPRFIVLANWVDSNFPSGGAAVLDRETGLVWERKPFAYQPSNTFFPTSTSFVNAYDSCAVFDQTGGRAGWRLPRLDELMSLLDAQTFSLPAGHPFQGVYGTTDSGGLVVGTFWVSDVNADQPTQRYFVKLVQGGGYFVFRGTLGPYGYWCVRGPMK